MNKKSIRIIVINLIILISYHCLIAYYSPQGKEYHLSIHNNTELLMLLIFIQFLYNVIAYSNEHNSLRFIYLLSAFLVFIIGGGLCSTIDPFHGF